jgi:outer membrane lipoprotein carrier protein
LKRLIKKIVFSTVELSFILNLVLPVLLAFGGASAAVQQPDVRAIAHRVDEHYNHLRTMQAEFTESYRGAGVEREEAGTLWLKKPGKMRWEYRSPTEKLFVSDGKDAWFYLPADKQVRKTEVRKLDDLRSPLAFLLGKTKLQKELQGLSLAADQTPLAPGNVVLRGVPTAMADRVEQILLEVTPESRILRIQIQQLDGSITEYRFSQPRENLDLADQRFNFKLPAGVEVVDGDFGQ